MARLNREGTAARRHIYRLPVISTLALVALAGVLGTVYAIHNGTSAHQPTTVTDAAGQTTSYTYDEFGRIREIESAPRMGLQPGEDAPRALTKAERTTTYEYYPDDAPAGAGRLKKVIGPVTAHGSRSVTYEYDSHGRVWKETNEEGYATTQEYDGLDRPTKTIYPDGTYEEIQYNRLDAERFRDRLGRWTQRFHDSLRRISGVRDAQGRMIQYSKSAGSTGCVGCAANNDRLVDANGNATRWEYDLAGRMVRFIRPDNTDQAYTYEPARGRLIEVRDSKLQVKRYDYWSDDQLKAMTFANASHSTPGASFTYDPSYGRMMSSTDGLGTTTYTYHPPGALGAGQIATIDGPLLNDTTAYEYDELGRVVKRTLNGAVWFRRLDSLGRTTSIATPLGTFKYAYEGLSDRVTRLTYPTGQTATFTYYDHLADRRLREIHHEANGVTLAKFAYVYDAVGRITTWTQHTSADPEPAVWSYEYDRADQLVAATRAGGPGAAPKRYRCTYDAAGNRTVMQIDDLVATATFDSRNRLLTRRPGGVMRVAGTVDEPATVTVQGKPAEVDANNRFKGSAPVDPGQNTVTVAATDARGNTRATSFQVETAATASRTYTYDANGNLVSDGTRTFTWDAANRLVRVVSDSGEVARFEYDAFGRRARKVAGGVTHDYIYDGDMVVEEQRSTGEIIRYFHGAEIDQWLAAQGTSGASYMASDHLGSVVHLTDGSGQITLARSYDPWGNILMGNSAGPAFTGREWEPETGLYYYRMRYYDPALGAFISEDPVDFKDGLSRYAYVGGSPVNFVDPSGLARALTCSPNCPPYIEQAADNLCKNARRIVDYYIRRCVINQCLSRLPVVCDHWSCQFKASGYTDPGGARIYVCPGGSGPGQTSPCYERTIAHEMMHVCFPFTMEPSPRGPHYQMREQVADERRGVRCPF